MKLIFKIRDIYFAFAYRRHEHLLIFTRANGTTTDLIVDSFRYHPNLHPAFTEYKNLIKKL